MIDLLTIAAKSTGDVLRRFKDAHTPLPLKTEGDDVHLDETIQWLSRAMDNGKGGVASHYSLMDGRWLNPFPETTGYIIPTFFDFASHSGRTEFFDRAVALTDWLGNVQLENGACMKGSYDAGKGKNPPIIFNTGQNILGFLRAYSETGVDTYLENAVRAGNFLVSCTDELGIWNRALHNNLPHTYNSRTSWALLELASVTDNSEFSRIAESNLSWVMDQQQDNAWFANANFKPGELPNTHGIAYTARGLVESYRINGDERLLQSSLAVGRKMQRIFEIRRRLQTFWDPRWKNHGKYFRRMSGNYVCVTGNIQLSIVWMRLFELTNDSTFLNSAFKMTDYVKTLQDVSSRHKGVRGGIPGSFPIFGSYSVLKFPNWAAKFWADALMLKMEHQRTLDKVVVYEDHRTPSISQG